MNREVILENTEAGWLGSRINEPGAGTSSEAPNRTAKLGLNPSQKLLPSRGRRWARCGPNIYRVFTSWGWRSTIERLQLGAARIRYPMQPRCADWPEKTTCQGKPAIVILGRLSLLAAPGADQSNP